MRKLSIILVAAFCCLFAGQLFAAEAPADSAPAVNAAPPAPAPLPSFLAQLGSSGGQCQPKKALGTEAPKTQAVCVDCDSNQGYCTPGGTQCRNYCLALVGEIGFCNSECNCCVCPEVGPAPDPPGDGGGTLCQPVCRCDGVPGPQGLCPAGCRQVNCI